MMGAYFQLLRPRHWLKNLLLFVPLLFEGGITDTSLISKCFYGFIAFSLIASAVYVFNDILDVGRDRQHPQKKNRPIASGLIPVSNSYVIAIILAIIAVFIAVWLSTSFAIILSIYLILNILYSVKLKFIAIIDVSIIATGFLLRILSGGILTETPVSHWLVLMTFLLAFLLALGKRRHDLQLENEYHLNNMVKGYTPRFIDITITLFGSVTIVAYILYTISPEVTERIGSHYVYITCLPVLLGLMRYLQVLIVYNRPADPVDLLLKDSFLQIIVLVWLGIFMTLLYA